MTQTFVRLVSGPEGSMDTLLPFISTPLVRVLLRIIWYLCVRRSNPSGSNFTLTLWMIFTPEPVPGITENFKDKELIFIPYYYYEERELPKNVYNLLYPYSIYDSYYELWTIRQYL